MRATNGRLTYVRQTISIDELERGREQMTDIAYRSPAENKPCDLPPKGYFCTRAAGHEGPCATYPTATPSEPLLWDDDEPETRTSFKGVLVAVALGLLALVGGAALIAIVAPIVEAHL